MRWYVFQVSTAAEEKAAAGILELKINRPDVAHKIGGVLVPMQNVVEVKNNKKVSTARKMHAGYLYVELEKDDDLLYLIKDQVRSIVDCLGVVTQAEMDSVIHKVDSSREKPVNKSTHFRGEKVLIVAGPFANFHGEIEEVDHEKGTLKVMVSMFGRQTPVDLEFSGVQTAS